jgi:hypothetical protein
MACSSGSLLAHDLGLGRLKKDAVGNHQHGGVGAKKIVGNV